MKKRSAAGLSGAHALVLLPLAAWLGNALYALGAPGGWLKEYSPALVAGSLIAYVALHGSRRYGARALWRFMIIVFTVAWTIETISIVTGFPCRYYYTDIMTPFIWHVPVSVLPAYLLMAYASWSLAGVLLNRRGARPEGLAFYLLPVLAAVSMVVWDLSMDILRSTVEQRWIWIEGGSYYGIPLTNFMAWFGVTWLMFQCFALYLRDTRVNDWPEPPKDPAFWLSVPLAYSAFAGEYLLNPLTGTAAGLSVPVNGIEVPVQVLFEEAARICLFTMIPLSAAGVLAALRPQTAAKGAGGPVRVERADVSRP